MQSKQGHGPAAALLLAACLPMTSATTSLASDMRYGASRWAQIGDSPHHQFCGKARSPLENIFAELPAPPRLIIFNFLGLSTFHWLAEGKLRRDLQGLDRQLPKETACLFLTTIPTYRASINRPRWRAQANLEAALMETGSRCRVVAGHTPATIAAFENNRAYYRKRSNGTVRDPYHANAAGARRFPQLRGSAICRGVVQALFEANTPPVAQLPESAAAQSPPLPMAIPAVSLTAAGRALPD